MKFIHITLALATTTTLTYSAPTESSISCQVLTATNQVRTLHDVSQMLLGSTKLDDAACHTCQLMIDNNNLAHVLYDKLLEKQTYPRERAIAFGYIGSETAETILYQYIGDANATHAVQQWASSRGHLMNLLGEYEHIGSCACTDSAEAKVYYVQEFGSGFGLRGRNCIVSFYDKSHR
jgi:uncharacterized protein YkwD